MKKQMGLALLALLIGIGMSVPAALAAEKRFKKSKAATDAPPAEQPTAPAEEAPAATPPAEEAPAPEAPAADEAVQEEPGLSGQDGAPPDPTGETANQAYLVRLLVFRLGLAPFLPPNPTVIQCVNALLVNGIEPADGWQPYKLVTLADLARVLVQALRLTGQVQNPDDPRSYVAVLRSMDIKFGTIDEALENLRPLAYNLYPNKYINSDPTGGAGTGQSIQDVNVDYVLRDIEVVNVVYSVEFPPRPKPTPVTPD